MKDVLFTIRKKHFLTPQVFSLLLEGDTSDISTPGQFVNIRLPGLFLRRPISVADLEQERLTLIIKTVGKGTEQLASMEAGETLQILTGLGNGYDMSVSGEQPLLLGGGVGVPPLYYLAKCLREAGREVQAVLGFNTKEEVFLEEEFRALGCRVTVTTADGSYGQKGFVTDALPASYSHFYTCGPLPMLKAVYARTEGSGQFSFEERMGCGFGACMGCSMKTKEGFKRVCKEGPVFRKEEILWEEQI